jgi:hypothetical protein
MKGKGDLGIRLLIKSLTIVYVMLIVSSFAGVVKSAETTFIVEPAITLTGRYDSNFYRENTNDREAYTITVTPGIELGVETSKAELSLYYNLEAYFYEDKGDVPDGEVSVDEENYVGHLAILNALYSPVERLTLGLNDSFYVTRRPFDADRFADSTEREKYWVNRFTPGLYYEFKNRFSAGLRYRRTDIEYDESDEYDSIEHRGLLNLIYNPQRTLTLDLDYQVWTQENPDDLINDEYTSNQLQLLAEKRYKYFAFGGGIGFHGRNFTGAGDDSDQEFEDADVINWIVSITGQNPAPPVQKRRLALDFQRLRSHLYLAVERNFNNLGYYYDLFEATRYTASVGHIFYHKFHGILRGYYQNSDYQNYSALTPSGDTQTRDDDTWDYSAILRYLMTEKMSIVMMGGHQERDSNIVDLDYDNDYVYLGYEFNYDIGKRGPFSLEASYYR